MSPTEGDTLWRASATIALLLASLSVLPEGGDRRGSLVVLEFSRNSDYIVVAAESRQLDRDGKPLDDRGCKIVALGRETLFFVTGFYRIQSGSGKPWNAIDVAGAVYRESQNHDALKLSEAWGDKAIHWLYPLPRQELEALTRKTDRIVTGGFINFDGNGIPSVHYQKLGYVRDESNVIMRPGSESVLPGQVFASGNGQELVTEFLEAKTKRALDALAPNDVSRLASDDPAVSSNLVRKAIQFAIDYTTGQEKGTLGAPIDIAVLRKNRVIEWVSRKKECYKLDQDQGH